MNLKFVYALVSSENDYYAEQAVISMHTLRRHNPGCRIVLATDSPTLDTLTGNRSLIKEYVDECVVIDSPAGFTPLQRSRYVKTLIRRYVEGDFLYLDVDTVIMGPLDDLERYEGDVAATLFRHIRHWNEGSVPDRLAEFYRQTHIEEPLHITAYYNGGVILCKDNENGRRLFDAWHRFWLESSTKYGYHFDQCNLWRANASTGNIIVELDGIYNCQMIYMQQVQEYIDRCKVFHYQSCSRTCTYVPFKNPEVLEKIRQQGITPDIEYKTQNLIELYKSGIADELKKNTPSLTVRVVRRLCGQRTLGYIRRLFGRKP